MSTWIEVRDQLRGTPGWRAVKYQPGAPNTPIVAYVGSETGLRWSWIVTPATFDDEGVELTPEIVTPDDDAAQVDLTEYHQNLVVDTERRGDRQAVIDFYTSAVQFSADYATQTTGSAPDALGQLNDFWPHFSALLDRLAKFLKDQYPEIEEALREQQ